MATPPFLEKPPHFASPPFSSKNFQTPPFPSILKKLNPPLMGGGRVQNMFKIFVQISLSVNLSFNRNSPDIIALCEKFLSDIIFF